MAETQKMYLGGTPLNKTFVGDGGYTLSLSGQVPQFGDFAYGGYLFFVTGSDYYVATDSNIGGNFADVLGIDCGTTNGLGTGPTNTVLLANNGSSVATTAVSASINGETDWFIPSYDLLEIMCTNKQYIPNFSSGNIRSSTEGIGGSNRFYIGTIDIGNCTQTINTYKSEVFGPRSTRLVRKQTVV